MDFNALIAELRASSENLPNDSADRSLLSSVYCNKGCKVLDEIVENTDYDNVITGLWLVAAHFAEQLTFLKPVPALSELCFKLFRQCAKAVLNIQWQNIEEESSLRQNFLASLANLHAKLVPLDFPRFRLLEALTENPWTNPTLAKVMGGEVEEGDKEEVRCYIEQEDPIILQLRVDMMLKENCEEYALNLCNSCLSHPELQSDLGVRKTQLSLLYKLGQEDKLQEECQKLNIQDAVRIIKQLQTSKTHRQICTVLAQTFMVQNWIRPSDMEANKELLRLWIRHQVRVDREQDQFKESVWAMAKLSQSTEQIVIFIDVLREECGESYLQLYVDMCIFAINVDKGQMETNKKEGNMEAAAARRSDMASICAKLSCLCHHASLKVARICALTSFALKPSEQSFAKIGTFYGQGTDCCNKCGKDRNREPGTVNPATLYEVERLLNMLRPDYLGPDQSYANIQILCRRFLQDSLKNAQQIQRKQLIPQNSASISTGASIQVDVPPGNTVTKATSCRPTNVFEALSPQDYQNTQILLNRLRLQNITSSKISMPASSVMQQIYQSSTNRSGVPQPSQQSSFSLAGQPTKAQYMFDVEKVKSKQPYGVPVEQQHQYYLIKHEKELEQRRKNAQKKREEKTQQNINMSSQMQQQTPRLLQQHQQQIPKQQQQQHNEQVTKIIQSALQKDPNALQKLTQGASPGVVQAVLNIMKGAMLKSPPPAKLEQHQPLSQQTKPTVSSPQQGTLPTVSTLLKPSVQTHHHHHQKHQPQQQQHPQHKQQQPQQSREQSPPRRHPRPQLYAQPIIVSTASSVNPQNYQSGAANVLNSRSQVTHSSTGEKQSIDNVMLAKTHVEDIRRFMQMQMSNLQQKQIAEPRQMSGSTVTLTNMSMTNTSDAASFNLTNRPKTTVELAEQAALAKLQKQDICKPGMFQQPQQLKVNTRPEQMLPKSNQQQFVTSINRTGSNVQLQSTQHHQKLLHLQQQQNNVFSFHNNQSSGMAQNPVLPSSDELSGSIMGVDDTIIKELLQDSGILANTFPDIEVDTVGEDKSRKIPEYSMLPHSATPASNQMSKSPKQQLYSYSAPPDPQTTYTAQRLPASHHVRGNSVVSQAQNIASASNLPGSFVHSSISGVNKYSTLPITAGSMTQSSMNTSLNLLASNTFSGFSKQSSSNQQVRTHSKVMVSVSPRENISVLPKKEIKQEYKPTVDQLREMMKKEDIQGEIYMDAANNATYRCIICSFAFETLDHLREHVRNVCKPGLQSSSVYNTKIKQDRANSAKAGVETTTVFQCLRCFELCVSDAGIKQHRLTCKRVPTVPSDLKKEATNSKPKPFPKTSFPKQIQMKEPQDNSYNVPELPLPFPYPSLNAEAVLKSMSLGGSLTCQTPTSNTNADLKPQTSTSSAGDTIKATLNFAASFPDIPPKTSSINSDNVSLSSSTTSCHTNSPQIIVGSLSENAVRPSPIISPNINTSSSVPASEVHLLPQNKAVLSDTVGASVNMLEKDLNVKDIEKPVLQENTQTIPQPRYTEITGSGGSKFFKCGICCQTLCSLESFLGHWTECAVKNRNLLRKLELNEKPITEQVLETILAVITAVAAGAGTVPETINVDPDWSDVEDLYSLRDPCRVSPLDDESSEDSDSVLWYETDPSESHESTSEPDNIHEERDGTKIGSGCTNDVLGSKGRKDGQEKDNIERMVEDENKKAFKKAKRKFSDDTDEEAKTQSESEQIYVSTREAPPKLRDRKSLKPIHSFINETLISPFAKTVAKQDNAKLDELSKDVTDEEDEKASSESEAQSDGNSLYCKVCQTSYQTKRILLQHFAGKHLQPYTVKTVADSSSYFCHLCQKTFSTFMHYMQHVPNHSVTIYEKMKVFITSRKSTQRSERIASQRGFSKKSNTIPKFAKALKSKKAARKSAVDRLKQQLLAGKTQSVRDRLRLSKRKRSLPSTLTSSEDDHSSEASSNVVFKSKKSTESENWSDGETPITRSRNSRPRKVKSQSYHNEDDSSFQSLDQSGEDSDRGPRLARDRDDDYVLSEDLDSDGMDTQTPPTTRSRKRFAQNLISSNSKKKKINFDSELNDGTVCENDNSTGTEKCLDYTVLKNMDEDSNSSVLLLSQHKNGNFLPCNMKLEPQNESRDSKNMKEISETVESDKELVPTCVLFVRSLSKQQKERLKSCDLQPTVVLESLSLDNLHTSHEPDVYTAVTKFDEKVQSSALEKSCKDSLEVQENSISSVTTKPIKNNASCKDSLEVHDNSISSVTTKPIKNKNASFLDSFLSYLNRYPSLDTIEPGRKRSRSGPPRMKELQKRRGSIDLCQTSEPHESFAIMSCASSSTGLEAADKADEIATCNSNENINSSDNNQSTVQNIVSKFSTRRCSVNLGQRLRPEDINANRELLTHHTVTSQDKSSASVAVLVNCQGKTEMSDAIIVSSASSQPISEGKQVPIVCLKRSEKIDMYTIKPLVATVLPLSEKNCESEHVVSETNVSECKNYRTRFNSEEKEIVQKNGESQNRYQANGESQKRHSIRKARKGNGHVTVSLEPAAQTSKLSVELGCLQDNAVKTEIVVKTFTDLDTAGELTKQTCGADSFQSKLEESCLTVSPSLVEEDRTSAHPVSVTVSDEGIVDVLVSCRPEDLESPGVIENTGLGVTGLEGVDLGDSSVENSKVCDFDEPCAVGIIGNKDCATETVGKKDYISETVGNKDCVSETVGNKNYISETVGNKDYISETVGNKDCVSETVGNKNYISETVGNKDYISETVGNKDYISETVGDKDTVSETVNNKDYISETVGNKDCVSETFGNKDCVSETVGNKDCVSEIVGNKGYISDTVGNKDCVSEIILQQDTEISLSTEKMILKADVPETISSTDSLITSNTSEDYPGSSSEVNVSDSSPDSVCEVSTADVTELIVATQNRSVGEDPDLVEMPQPKVRKLEQVEHQDIASSEVEMLHNSSLADLQDNPSHSHTQSGTVETELDNCPKVENGSSTSYSEQTEGTQETEKEQQKYSKLGVVPEIVYTGLEVTNLSSGKFISDSKDMQQSDVCLNFVGIPERTDILDRVDLGTHISDVGGSSDKGSHTLPSIRSDNSSDSGATVTEDKNVVTCIPSAQSQDVKKSLVEIVENCQLNDELCSGRKDTDSASFPETSEDINKIEKTHNSAVVSDTTKQIIVGCPNDERVCIKMPSTRRDDSNFKDYLETDQQCSTPKEKSETHTCDTSRQLVDLLKREDACRESVVSSKVAKTFQKKDRKPNAILDPSISLAAFIAERLTKEYLEPLRGANMSHTKKVSGHQTENNSDWDIDCHVTECKKPVCLKYTEDNPPFESGHLVADNAESQSSGLVDYSSSEEEGQLCQQSGQTDVSGGQADVSCGQTDVSCGQTDVSCGQTDVSGDGGQADVSGDGGQADVSGDGGQADVSGDGGQADVSGDGGQADVSGDGSQADVSGGGGKADVSGGGGGQADVSGDGGQADVSVGGMVNSNTSDRGGLCAGETETTEMVCRHHSPDTSKTVQQSAGETETTEMVCRHHSPDTSKTVQQSAAKFAHNAFVPTREDGMLDIQWQNENCIGALDSEIILSSKEAGKEVGPHSNATKDNLVTKKCCPDQEVGPQSNATKDNLVTKKCCPDQEVGPQSNATKDNLVTKKCCPDQEVGLQNNATKDNLVTEKCCPDQEIGPHSNATKDNLVTEKCCPDQEGSSGCDMLESNTVVFQNQSGSTVIKATKEWRKCHDTWKKEIQDTKEVMKDVDVPIEYSEKVLANETQVIHGDSLETVNKNQKESTNEDVSFHIDGIDSKKTLNIVNEDDGKVLSAEDSETEISHKCIKEGNDIALMSISNAEKQTESNICASVVTLSSSADERCDVSTPGGGFEGNQYVAVQQMLCCEQETFVEDESEKAGTENSSRVLLCKVSVNMLESKECDMSWTTTSCEDNTGTEECDLGYWAAHSELYEKPVEMQDIDVVSGVSHRDLSDENAERGDSHVVSETFDISVRPHDIDALPAYSHLPQHTDGEHSGGLSHTNSTRDLLEEDLVVEPQRKHSELPGGDERADFVLQAEEKSVLIDCIHDGTIEEIQLSPILIAHSFDSQTGDTGKNICNDHRRSNGDIIKGLSEGKVLLPHGSWEEHNQTSEPDWMVQPSVQDLSSANSARDEQTLMSDADPAVPGKVIQGVAEHESHVFGDWGGVSHENHSSSEDSNSIFPKETANLVVKAAVRSGSSSSSIGDLPEIKTHFDSEQQAFTLNKDMYVPCQGGNGNGKDTLCSDDSHSDKGSTYNTQIQQSGLLCTPLAERIVKNSQERDLKGDADVFESACEVAELHCVVGKRSDHSLEVSGLEHTELYASSIGADPLSLQDNTKSHDYSGIQHEIDTGKSATNLQMTGDTKLGITVDMKSLQSEDKDNNVADESSTNDAEVSTSDLPDSPCEKRKTDHETDDGDDLSDFDLVIENDTSYRNLSFPITLEKKSYSSVPLLSSSSYIYKRKLTYPSSGPNTATMMGAMSYKRILTKQEHQSPLGQRLSPALGKSLIGAKNVGKSYQEQFVWDVADESYRKVTSTVSRTIPRTSFHPTKNNCAIEAVSNPALEALKRKQKALREKTDTAPFTWDLEDFSDNPVSNHRSLPCAQSSTKTASDILSFGKPSHGKTQDFSVSKVNKRITQCKRPLTPDVSQGKMPAKFRRTSSVDRQTKNCNAPVAKEQKKESALVSKCEDGEISSILLKDSSGKFSSNSITVDEDISFKKDSFSPPVSMISSADSQSQGIHEVKVRRDRSHKQSHNTSLSTFAHHDEKSESYSPVDDDGGVKNQPGLRSRHSSVESNKSDKSVTSKRAADGIPQITYKRSRKSEDPLTPKLKKIGLIKITKDSLSPPAATSASDSPAPLTRSSEAAIKAFNQKSLRSRGVNPVQPSNSPPVPASKIVPQNVQPKNIPEASSRLKSSISVVKLSPVSANTVKNSIVEAKTDTHSKSSRKSLNSTSATMAVVKRRSPTISVPSGVGRSKAPISPRPKKGITGHGRSHHSSASTTIFRVDPLPNTVVSEGLNRSEVVSSVKGTRTLHTPLPPGTTVVRPKKDASKQPKWKISKETKLVRGKKQQRGPLSFKRT